MGITSYPEDDGRKVIIEVSGRFDFQLHREFRAAYEGSMEARHFRVDLRDITYVDSSALGLLLLLRDHAGGDTNAVSIASRGDVLKVIKSACFENLFCLLELDDSEAAPSPTDAPD